MHCQVAKRADQINDTHKVQRNEQKIRPRAVRPIAQAPKDLIYLARCRFHWRVFNGAQTFCRKGTRVVISLIALETHRWNMQKLIILSMPSKIIFINKKKQKKNKITR